MRGAARAARFCSCLLACNGEGGRISQKIWDFGRRSLDERWQAGYAAGADTVAGSSS